MAGVIFVVTRFMTPLGLHRRAHNHPCSHDNIRQKRMGDPFCFLTVNGQCMSGT
jgi:hypothetical protein